MSTDEAREHIGAGVVYTAPHGATEDGVITSVNDRFVFVRYRGSLADHGQATPAEALTLLAADPAVSR